MLAMLRGELGLLSRQHGWSPDPRDIARRKVVDQVWLQQFLYFTKGEKPKGRVVCLAKPFLRPIVRRKETKSVEFGTKVNKFQVDGINFIAHLDFNASNEDTKLRASIFMARTYFGKVDLVGADAIYATNKNRKYCNKQGIRTGFKHKERAGKYEDQRKALAKTITKERASRLEGSFGKE